MDSRLSLVCSMRRAMPYPCWGPMALSVLRTIRASVPCQTSAFVLILVSHMSMAGFLWEDKTTTGDCRRLTPCSVHDASDWDAARNRAVMGEYSRHVAASVT